MLGIMEYGSTPNTGMALKKTAYPLNVYKTIRLLNTDICKTVIILGVRIIIKVSCYKSYNDYSVRPDDVH